MPDFDTLVAGILDKISTLSTENEKLGQEVKRLSEENRMQEEALKNPYINKLLSNSQTNNITQQQGKTQEAKGDPSDIKNRIIEINRVIDHCLSLLTQHQ